MCRHVLVVEVPCLLLEVDVLSARHVVDDGAVPLVHGPVGDKSLYEGRQCLVHVLPELYRRTVDAPHGQFVNGSVKSLPHDEITPVGVLRHWHMVEEFECLAVGAHLHGEEVACLRVLVGDGHEDPYVGRYEVGPSSHLLSVECKCCTSFLVDGEGQAVVGRAVLEDGASTLSVEPHGSGEAGVGYSEVTI